MKKLALSTTFEEWYKSSKYINQELQGNLMKDFEYLEHFMVLDKFLPQLPQKYVYHFEECYNFCAFNIDILSNNYLYNVGYIILHSDGSFKKVRFDYEKHLNINQMGEVLNELCIQMLSYYKKHNIGTEKDLCLNKLSD